MIASGSTALPLTDSSSEPLNSTYQNRRNGAKSENVISYFFGSNNSSLFKQAFQHVATQLA